MTKSDAEILAEAEALDRAYAEADKFHAARLPTRTAYKVSWDNGASACGSFPEIYDNEADAESAAERIEAEAHAEGLWDEDGCCEVIEIEVPIESPEVEDEMAILRQAALSNGRP